MILYGVEGEVELTCSIGDEDGIIYLTMGGNITKDTLEVFNAWAEKVKEAMRIAHSRATERVLTLIDATRVEQADMHSIEILHTLMEYNKQFVTKTAVFGANYFNKIIIEMALHLTRRTNMKLFNTRDEALQWLLKNDSMENS